MVKYNREEVCYLFKDFKDEDFTRVMLVSSMSGCGVEELINEVEGHSIPLVVVSGLVNVQRYLYDLPSNRHKSYEELRSDKVVCNSEYNGAKELHLVLCSLLVEMKFVSRRGDGRVVMDIRNVIKTINNGATYLSKGVKGIYDIESFISYLEGM